MPNVYRFGPTGRTLVRPGGLWSDRSDFGPITLEIHSNTGNTRRTELTMIGLWSARSDFGPIGRTLVRSPRERKGSMPHALPIRSGRAGFGPTGRALARPIGLWSDRSDFGPIDRTLVRSPQKEVETGESSASDASQDLECIRPGSGATPKPRIASTDVHLLRINRV